MMIIGAGVETPTSEPGFCMTDGLWDSDVESDSEDFVFKHHVIINPNCCISKIYPVVRVL